MLKGFAKVLRIAIESARLSILISVILTINATHIVIVIRIAIIDIVAIVIIVIMVIQC